MTTSESPATWGTWKHHGHAARLMFHGNRKDRCLEQGVEVTMTPQGARVEMKAADGYIVPGVPSLFIGPGKEFWARPVS